MHLTINTKYIHFPKAIPASITPARCYHSSHFIPRIKPYLPGIVYGKHIIRMAVNEGCK
jgi:hypothetical protein